MGSFIERFEQRRLLAAATASLNNGTLTVTGTDAAEKISLSQKAGHGADQPIVVTSDSGSGSKAKRTDLGSFDPDDVDQINVTAGGGKDSITLSLNTDIPAVLDGGTGNDDVRTNRGGVTLKGGAGNDVLRSQADVQIHTSSTGGDASFNYVLQNGAITRSVLSATSVNATAAQAGTLTLDRTGGTYTLASIGSPRSLISATYNRLDGGKGNDTLYTRGGEDTLVGGTGDDHYVPLNQDIEARNGDLTTLKKSSARETKSRVALFGIEVIAAPQSLSESTQIKATNFVTLGNAGQVTVRTGSLKSAAVGASTSLIGSTTISSVDDTAVSGGNFAVIYTHAGTTQPIFNSSDPSSWPDPLSGQPIPSRPASLVPGNKYPAATVNNALFPGLTIFTASSRLRVLMIQEPDNGKVTSYAYDESDDSVVVKEADTMTDLMVPATTDVDGGIGYRTDLQKLLTLD